MEYAIYPFEYMRITQRHDEGNHLPHWYPFKGCSDKPWDEGCKDGGRSYFVPKNDYKIVEKIKNKNGCNNVVLLSCNKLKIPYQEKPTYIYLSLTHLNNDDYDKISVGQIIHKGEKKIREGTSGATANHFHITAGLPKYYGYEINGNGKYCFVCEKSLTPEQAFYVDDSVDILGANGYKFEEVPTKLEYQAHCQGIGWQEWKHSGEIAGTTGEKRRMEAIRINSKQDVYAKAHIQGIGWVDYGKINKDTIIGTTGEYKRLECLCLKGNFKYRVHISTFGWTNWTDADGISTLGSVGQKLSLEAIEIIEKIEE